MATAPITRGAKIDRDHPRGGTRFPAKPAHVRGDLRAVRSTLGRIREAQRTSKKSAARGGPTTLIGHTAAPPTTDDPFTPDQNSAGK